jgi:anti-sigma B factor antagonist
MDLLMIHIEPGPPPVLRVQGEVDMASADQLRDALGDALEADPTLVVDLAGVTFIDVAGLRAILGPAESLNGRGPLTLVNAGRVARLLAVLDLGDIPSIVIRGGA